MFLSLTCLLVLSEVVDGLKCISTDLVNPRHDAAKPKVTDCPQQCYVMSEIVDDYQSEGEFR